MAVHEVSGEMDVLSIKDNKNACIKCKCVYFKGLRKIKHLITTECHAQWLANPANHLKVNNKSCKFSEYNIINAKLVWSTAGYCNTIFVWSKC